tara:strand:+ start:146 stop:973 length:828 start_codon:yes stop_codon:yes gene_type:complete
MSNINNFDLILKQLKKKNTNVSDFLGKHVHLGYWPTPISKKISVDIAAENLSKEICLYAQIKNGQNILDVGCGFGGTISYLNENFSNLKLLGLNIDARQLDVAKKNICSKHQNNLSFVHDDACTMDKIYEKFDHIIAIECLFYFSSRFSFFEQSLKYLKKGGSITISDFIMSPFLIPTCKFLNIVKCKWLNPFGSLNFVTLKKYYDLSHRFNLKIEVYDITGNTILSYDVLKNMMSEFGLNKFKVFLWKRGCSLLKFFAYIEFNRYLIIKFTRTC